MTTDPPQPGSAWARFCPDAYPIDWYDALGLTALPVGFARFATDDEAALIVGRITPEEFTGRSRHRPASAPVAPQTPIPGGRGNANSVGQRFRDLSTFLRTVHAALTPTQRAIWLAVYTYSQAGSATVTQETLAKIAGVTIRAVQKAIPGLRKKGLLDILEKGRPGRSSVYRYRLG